MEVSIHNIFKAEEEPEKMDPVVFSAIYPS